MKEFFLLDPEVIFLNHGSFGACPRAVFDKYQEWQCQLEQQPVLFLGRVLQSYLKQARQALGAFFNTEADDLVFIPNATYGVNLVAHSLALKPGDEILTSNHEYGACDNTWDFICKKTGSKYIHQPISLPVQSVDDFVEEFWQAVTPNTRLIFLSHITSPTAQLFPVEAISARARQSGILTLIDGAHAPGQIPLNLPAIGADFYTGNAHKWMMSPKGAAFLYARRDVQNQIEPLVVSWGYRADLNISTGSRFVDLLEWTGTHDPAAALSVPAAIQFMHDHEWDHVRSQCHGLLNQTLDQINEMTQLPTAYAKNDKALAFPPQVGIAMLPPISDLAILKSRLYDEFSIEVPLIVWNNRQFIRISIQGYNTSDDTDVLIHALEILLPQSI
jgi:isopenicillin-N epimerase